MIKNFKFSDILDINLNSKIWDIIWDNLRENLKVKLRKKLGYNIYHELEIKKNFLWMNLMLNIMGSINDNLYIIIGGDV